MKLALQITEALEAAHERGVVHRDLKPENILMDKDSPAISDLGIAFAEDQTKSTQTKSRSRLGSKDYSAPEQMDSPHDVSEKVDYYSFGVVLFELITGALPQRTDNVPTALSGQLRSWEDPLRMAVIDLIGSLLTHDPVRRPEHQEIEAKLSEIGRLVNA